MADALRWLFEVQNRISGPAKTAAGDLKKLRERLAGATAATKAFNAAQRGPALGSSRGKTGSPFDRRDIPRSDLLRRDLPRRILPRLTPPQSFRMRGDGLRDVMDQLRRVGIVLTLWRGLRAVGDMMMRIARGAAELTRHFTEMVIAARMMRAHALFGLERILGDRGAARSVLRDARELSEFLGTDLTQTVQGIQDLLVRGFSRDEAFLIFQGLADLQTISPTPVDISRIVLAIGQIRNAGRLQGDELRQLQESGLPLDAVREAMARRLGTSTDRLAELQRAGRIDADTAIASILEGITMRTGRELGGAAREFSQTLPGQLMRLRQAPARIFDAIAESSDDSFGGLRDLLGQINRLLDPTSSSFRSLVDLLASGFSVVIDLGRTAFDVGRALFEGIFGATGQSAARGFKDSLQGIRDALAWLREPDTLANIRSFGVLLVAMWRASEPLRKVLLAIGAAVGVVVAAITVSLGTIVAAAAAVPTAIIAALSTFVGLAEQIIPRAFTWGASIVDGLIAGIRSRLEVLRAAAQSMGSTVVSAVTRTLGIASPSREMRWLGEMTGLGFQQGLDASMPNIVVPTPQIGGGVLGGGASIAVTIGDIHVHGESAGEVANELRRILPAELQSAFEQIVAQYGMA